ncbi:MAG: TROVE domain-containing protein [Armatimonadetes bacterium]|nr:TROVE domain-containing protein [Armatimonadota bacterium]
MNYAELYSGEQTPQQVPIPGAKQVPNSEGGFVYSLDEWKMLDRFLILGTEGGTFYVREAPLALDNAQNAAKLIEADGVSVVQRVVEISDAGRAPKTAPASFVLALAASIGNLETRRAALAAVPQVCRTASQLYEFCEQVQSLRGWGRGLRRAIGDWFSTMPVGKLTYQAIKYQNRNGWSGRDLLRLAHPKPISAEHRALFKWMVDGELAGPNPQLEASTLLKTVNDPDEAARLIRAHRLPREAVPTELLRDPEVWEALLEDMPLTAMIRNLGNMSKVGLLVCNSKAARIVCDRLADQEWLRSARVHPVSVLMALRTYQSGRGLRGHGTWAPVQKVVEALEAAFYLAFANIEPTGKRTMLGLDVSGSMSWLMPTGITCAEGAAAMLMAALKTENGAIPMAFAHDFRPLNVTGRSTLQEALEETRSMNFGGTDCALPMIYATRQRIAVDLFVVYTDNETWYGKMHPKQALEMYRQKMGIDAKLAVVGMTATEFSIADPADAGMLDLVGFDASIPTALREFAVG